MSQVTHFIVRHESQEKTEHCTDFINKYFESNATKKNLCSKLNSNPNRKYLNVVLRVSQSSPHKTDIWNLQCLLSLFVIDIVYCSCQTTEFHLTERNLTSQIIIISLYDYLHFYRIHFLFAYIIILAHSNYFSLFVPYFAGCHGH